MVNYRKILRFVCRAGCLAWLGLLTSSGWGQQPPYLASPSSSHDLTPLLAQSPTAKLATPRATLKTLYFSIIAYDFYPTLIDDAVACLEQGPDQARDIAETARLAIELNATLRELCLPVNAVPENPAGDTVVLFDGDGFKIALRRQTDGLWRFDRDTVAWIPAMYRLALQRHQDLQARRAGLHEDYADPSSTLRRFLVDGMAGDYYAAAQALDLSRLPTAQRSDCGPLLAQQLLFVIQRRGWIYFQEVPNNPDGPPYTWHADRDGRIVLERVHLADGKDAWLFSRRTMKNLEKMYQAAQQREPDARYVQLGCVVPPLPADALQSGSERPPSVPPQLGSPRAVLKGFFGAIDEGELDNNRLLDAIGFLDLEAMPSADRPVLGVKLAGKLDAVLRKLEIDLDTIPDSWNAPAQVLGKARGLRVELVRLRDGSWRFSKATVEQIPQLFEQMGAQEQSDRKQKGRIAKPLEK